MAKSPTSENWSVSAVELAERFRGRRFGELVLYHVKREKLSQVMAALTHTISLLPPQLQGATEEWIDITNQYGLNDQFWRSDCGEVCLSILEKAKEHSLRNSTQPDNDTLLNLFQIVVLNFAYGAHREPSSKAFIQKAIGIGFLRRFFSYRKPR